MRYIGIKQIKVKDLPRTYTKDITTGVITIEEYATLYSCFLKLEGFAGHSTWDWRYKKSQYKSISEVVKAHIAEAYKRGNI